MESKDVRKPSKNQVRKQKRYGKKPSGSVLASQNKPDVDLANEQFIESLLKPRPIIDHSLDDLDDHKLKTDRKRHGVYNGDFESGKNR